MCTQSCTVLHAACVTFVVHVRGIADIDIDDAVLLIPLHGLFNPPALPATRAADAASFLFR